MSRATAYVQLGGLVQLRGGVGRVWASSPGTSIGTSISAAGEQLASSAKSSSSWLSAGSVSRWPQLGLGPCAFKVVVSDAANAEAAHHQDRREARSCFDAGGVRMLFSVTATAARPMVFSRRQAQFEELFRSHADLVIMDREAAGSGGCSSTFHGRLGAGVTISTDVVPAAYRTGLIAQHPICSTMQNTGTGVPVNSSRNSDTAAASTARSAKAVEQVYERFEAACDDLDSGLFDRADRHCYCCMLFFDGAGGSESRTEDGRVTRCAACSYQVHGKNGRGGKHSEFATTARPNDRCPAGCPGCTT
jgi:hypothetical protein